MSAAKILVIDQDEKTREVLRQNLVERGYTVELQDDGIRALVSIDQRRPDLIISEVDLPRVDGLELGRAIKGHDETRAVPVIFLTSRSDARSMIEGINVGAKFYITKPFESAELLVKVKKAL